MRPRNERTGNPQPSAPAPRKRFRLERLEERIAPAKGGKGTNNCGGANTSLSGGTIY